MRSPAETRTVAHATRRRLEWACRLGAIAAVMASAWMLWHHAPGAGDAGAVQVVTSDAALDSIVIDHLVGNAAGQSDGRRDMGVLSLALTRVPDDTRRALLGGLPRAGVPVVWRLAADSASDVATDATLAAAVVRTAGPDGDLVVRSTRQAGPLVLRDAGGLLDSVPGGPAKDASAMSWHLRAVTWPLTVAGSRTHVPMAQPDSTRGRSVRVLGQAGWEYKFTVAALEELGWRVDGAVRVSPTAQVILGAATLGAATLGAAPLPLDTARHAAVVITDSIAVDAGQLQRFVEAGGGLVLLGDALRIPVVAAMRPAVATERRGAVAGALLTDTPLSGLEAWELRPDADAVVLESVAGDADGAHGHDEPVLVARRRGAGRVLAVAYREMWRWRMEGRDDGIDAHRAWWRRTLAAAGAASAPPAAPDVHPGAGAPYADLVSWVGAAQLPTGQDVAMPARSTGVGATGGPARDWRRFAPWLGALALMLLCIEWGSRRLRGVR